VNIKHQFAQVMSLHSMLYITYMYNLIMQLYAKILNKR